MRKLVFGASVAALATWMIGQAPIRVPYSEVTSRVEIIGRLGEPLGTFLVLDGVRFGNSTGPTMMGGGNYRVLSVNGKKLEKPVELWIAAAKNITAGTRCKVEGYETGGMIGIPDEAVQRGGLQPQQAAWQFAVEFVTTKANRTVGVQHDGSGQMTQ